MRDPLDPKIPAITLIVLGILSSIFGQEELGLITACCGILFFLISLPGEPEHTGALEDDENTASTTSDSAVGRSREDENKR